MYLRFNSGMEDLMKYNKNASNSCLYNLIKNHNDFLIALKTILIGASLVSILGIFEEITRVNVFSFLNTDYELIYNPLRFGLLRILGFSQHTIAHGVYVDFKLRE